MVSFQRPIGAAADLQELEYVSALLQTQQSGSGARRDGSVQDVDIQLFLKSRFGIDVSLKDIQRLVIHAFGDGDVIDLSEMTAMLLIPTLIKATATAQEEEEETDDIQYPKPGLIQSVLSMILRDVTGSSKPPKLTVSLLHDILLAYGEESMSNDVDLLREMATFGEVLNEETFSRALTNDVLLYNVNDEATLTTNYRDVMKPIRNEKEEDTVKMSLHDDSDDQDYLLENGKQDLPQTKQAPATIQRFWSSPGIDFTACRYSSKFIVVFLWTGFVISYIAYFGRIVREETSYQFDNVCPPTSNFGCRIMLAIVEWLFILATLCGFGLAYVALSCTGNGIEDTRKWTRVIAIVMIGFWTWFLFLLLYSKEDRTVGEVYSFDEDGNRVYEGDVVLESSQPYEAVVYFLSLIIGNIVILLELYMMFGDTVRRRCFNKASLVKFFTASGIKAEAANKTAAAYKMNALVDNARQIHSYSSKDIDHGETSFGAGLLNFSVRGEEFEEAGGFLWTWTRLFNKDLFQQEGVWISARLLAGNFAQLLISAFVLTYGIAFTRYIIEEWQKGKQDPSRFLYLALERFNVLVQVEDYASTTCNFLTDITNGALNASSILLLSVDNTTCATVAGHAINRTIEGISDSLYPQEQYMVEVPMIVATAVAFISTLALVVVYIPSVASTTLQFRSGVIPLFHDDYNFELYRSRLDNITILLGSMFWSALYAAGFVGILLGTIVFLFLWQVCSIVVSRKKKRFMRHVLMSFSRPRPHSLSICWQF